MRGSTALYTPTHCWHQSWMLNPCCQSLRAIIASYTMCNINFATDTCCKNSSWFSSLQPVYTISLHSVTHFLTNKPLFTLFYMTLIRRGVSIWSITLHNACAAGVMHSALVVSVCCIIHRTFVYLSWIVIAMQGFAESLQQGDSVNCRLWDTGHTSSL